MEPKEMRTKWNKGLGFTGCANPGLTKVLKYGSMQCLNWLSMNFILFAKENTMFSTFRTLLQQKFENTVSLTWPMLDSFYQSHTNQLHKQRF